MKHSRTFSRFWLLPIAVLAGTALAASLSASLGQAPLAPAETQDTAPIIFLSGPSGDRFTLVRSAVDGWRLQAGWKTEETRSGKAVLAAVGTLPVAAEQTLERPLTVFVDGPTGFTFMYVLDEGWKFVGRIAERAR